MISYSNATYPFFILIISLWHSFFLVFSKRCITAQPMENGSMKRWEQSYQNVSQVLSKAVYMYTMHMKTGASFISLFLNC